MQIAKIYAKGIFPMGAFITIGNAIGYSSQCDEEYCNLDKLIPKICSYSLSWPVSGSLILCELLYGKEIHTFKHYYLIDFRKKSIPRRPINTRLNVLRKHFVPNSTEYFLIEQDFKWKLNLEINDE